MKTATIDRTILRTARSLKASVSLCPECGRLGVRAVIEPGQVLYQHVLVEGSDAPADYSAGPDVCVANELPLVWKEGA